MSDTILDGEVYIFANDLHPNLSKIGFSATVGGSVSRLEHYSKEHALEGWYVYATFPCFFPQVVEAQTHRIFRTQRHNTVTDARELFRIPPAKARPVIEAEIAKVNQRLPADPARITELETKVSEVEARRDQLVQLTHDWKAKNDKDNASWKAAYDALQAKHDELVQRVAVIDKSCNALLEDFNAALAREDKLQTRIAELEAALTEVDAEELHEQVKTLDERLCAARQVIYHLKRLVASRNGTIRLLAGAAKALLSGKAVDNQEMLENLLASAKFAADTAERPLVTYSDVEAEIDAYDGVVETAAPERPEPNPALAPKVRPEPTLAPARTPKKPSFWRLITGVGEDF